MYPFNLVQAHMQLTTSSLLATKDKAWLRCAVMHIYKSYHSGHESRLLGWRWRKARAHVRIEDDQVDLALNVARERG